MSPRGITLKGRPVKNYLLFGGDKFYPSGGWQDFKGHFDDIPQALTAAAHGRWEWWQIVNAESGELAQEGIRQQQDDASMGAVEGWVITHDGETIKAGLQNTLEAINWIHQRHSYSADHAVLHEGYDIVHVRGGKVDWSYKRDLLKRKR